MPLNDKNETNPAQAAPGDSPPGGKTVTFPVSFVGWWRGWTRNARWGCKAVLAKTNVGQGDPDFKPRNTRKTRKMWRG